MKTIEQAIRAATDCLQAVGLEDPRLESEFLLAAFLQIPRARVVLDRFELLTPENVQGFQGWLHERQQRKPLAYVTGEQPFRDLRIKVSTAVLIPRPETELLVEQALRVLDHWDGFATVVDVGTGSGNIALSLLSHRKIQRLIGLDVSAEALDVARENERHIRRGLAVEWFLGDLLAPLRKRHIQADVIVANLPYIRSSEMKRLEPELYWEPRLALEAGEDGLRAIAPCISQAIEVLQPGGVLLLEIGATQSQAVISILAKNTAWTETQMFRDLGGHPRIVQTRKRKG